MQMMILQVIEWKTARFSEFGVSVKEGANNTINHLRGRKNTNSRERNCSRKKGEKKRERKWPTLEFSTY